MKKISSLIVVILLIIVYVGYNQVIKHQQIREKEAVINTAKDAIKSQKEFEGKTIKIKILGVKKIYNDWFISYQYSETGKNVVPNVWLPINGHQLVNVKKEQNGKLQAFFIHFGSVQKSSK